MRERKCLNAISIMCACVAGGVMAADQPVAVPHYRRGGGGGTAGICGAVGQTVRRVHHAGLFPRRDLDEAPQDVHPASHRVLSGGRSVSR